MISAGSASSLCVGGQSYSNFLASAVCLSDSEFTATTPMPRPRGGFELVDVLEPVETSPGQCRSSYCMGRNSQYHIEVDLRYMTL